jgi:hypothetical protein
MTAASEGRCTTAEEDEAIEAIGGERAALYGEITTIGFRTLAARVVLSSTDVFADLGSGLGRAVFQAAREYGVTRSVGVEMAGTRHELAVAALDTMPDIADRVILVEADCSDASLWLPQEGTLAGVTVIFMGSLMFSEELMGRLARVIEASPTVRAVATLKAFPDGQPIGAGFREEDKGLICETSWTAPLRAGDNGCIREPGCPVHLYIRP